MNGGNNQNLSYTVNNGVPTSFTEQANCVPAVVCNARGTTRSTRRIGARADACTVQGAVRWDHAWSWFPATDIGGVRFLPQGISFADTKDLPLGQGGVDSYKDITPRIGVAYDVFGNGKTALKVNLGRYLEAAQLSGNYVGNQPSARISTTATRNWTDANKNFIIDCNLFNNGAQSPATTGSIDTCSAAPSTFGTASQVTRVRYGAAQRMGRPSRRLGLWRERATAGAAARVNRSRLQPPMARQLRGHRQPRPAGLGLRAVLGRGACRSAAAWRRRPDDHGPLQRQSKRRESERRHRREHIRERRVQHAGIQLRKSVVALQRRTAQRERPRPQWSDVPRRRQHRQNRERCVRDPSGNP